MMFLWRNEILITVIHQCPNCCRVHLAHTLFQETLTCCGLAPKGQSGKTSAITSPVASLGYNKSFLWIPWLQNAPHTIPSPTLLWCRESKNKTEIFTSLWKEFKKKRKKKESSLVFPLPPDQSFYGKPAKKLFLGYVIFFVVSFG